MSETPNYIKSLLMPNPKKASARRVWGIELELVWLPFFTATNAQGDSAIPSDALGCPLRLGYEADGSVKFSKTGRPVTKVVKELADCVRMVKDNFTAGLLAYAGGVYESNPEGYKLQVEQARVEGGKIDAGSSTEAAGSDEAAGAGDTQEDHTTGTSQCPAEGRESYSR